jgi:hypothetical protein
MLTIIDACAREPPAMIVSSLQGEDVVADSITSSNRPAPIFLFADKGSELSRQLLER